MLISSRVKTTLIADMAVKASDIDVSSSQGVVTLIGWVRSAAMQPLLIAAGIGFLTGLAVRVAAPRQGT